MLKVKLAGENGMRLRRIFGGRGMRTPRELTVRVEQRGDAAIMHIRGRLTIVASHAAEGPLQEAVWSDARRIVINLAECTFLDTTGIAILVANLKRARVAGKELVLAGVGPQAASVLQVTRLSSIFAMAADVAAALSAPAETFELPADDYVPIDGGASG